MFHTLMIAAALSASTGTKFATGANALSGVGRNSGPPRPGDRPARTAQKGWVSPGAARKPVFFASSTGAGSTYGAVQVFDATDSRNPAPVASIVDGISVPVGVALDKQGTLYVANSGANTITEYAKGQITPTATLTNGLNFPNFMAMAPDGTLAVVNLSSTPDIVVFNPHGTQPARTIVCATMPSGLAYDHSGNLYIADILASFGPSTVLRVPPKSTKCTDLNLQHLDVAQGIAVDLHNNIWVGDNITSTIHVYPPGSIYPNSFVLTEFEWPVALAFDRPDRYLYVADFLVEDAIKLPYQSNESFIGWNQGLREPLGVTVSQGAWF